MTKFQSLLALLFASECYLYLFPHVYSIFIHLFTLISVYSCMKQTCAEGFNSEINWYYIDKFQYLYADAYFINFSTNCVFFAV